MGSRCVTCLSKYDPCECDEQKDALENLESVLLENEKLKAENEKLKKCVKYYSYEGLYNWYHDKDDNFAVTTDIEKDMGETARQVLKDIEGK